MEIRADEDPYVDDDIDQLPAATFEALEEGISRHANSRARPVTQERDVAVEQSVSRSLAFEETGAPVAKYKESSDYGSDDDDIINLDAQSMLLDGTNGNNKSQWYPLREPSDASVTVQRGTGIRQHQKPTSNTGLLQRVTYTNQSATQTPRWSEVNEDVKPDVLLSTVPDENTKVNDLLAKIRHLERERDGLHDAVKSASSNVQAKAGEIAIVRSNYDKATKEYERRLAEMQKQHIQELAKERAGLEAAKRDREKVETSNKFLEHDLAQEAEKSRNLKKILKESVDTGADPRPRTGLSTPRRAKLPPFRDGFEDDEVAFASPSRTREKSKSSTPTSAAKRKRQSYDVNPVQPLILSQGDRQSPRYAQNHPQKAEIVVKEKLDPRFAVAQSILNHRAMTRNRRTIEVFAEYHLPSGVGTALSGPLYEILTQYSLDMDESHFAIKFCNSLFVIWKNCLAEKYYDPLHDLIDWLHFCVLSAPLSVAPLIFQDILPLCLATTDVISLPVAKAFKDPSNFSPPSTDLGRLIDPTRCLELLLLICERCSTNLETLARFWTSMEFDFVLLMLHRAQPLQQIKAMLRLLYHSVLPNSFGALAVGGPDSMQQRKIESDILDRLTSLLFETPYRPEVTAKLHRTQRAQCKTKNELAQPTTSANQEILSVRVMVVSVLQALCFTFHGGNALAMHRLATGRLVRFLHENVIALQAHRTATHDTTATAVNATVRILAHLTSCHAPALDLRTRLASAPGGPQKHLVALARVAFADGMVGVDVEVVEAAHRMLDEYLSPEEGEAVVDVFSTAPLRSHPGTDNVL